ncbi:9620_t:CDS:1 [Acaulospora morrowiae]|uniref:9620_t:CDS:1 n=1 Tax=Acaulospora morrowiae TaxID=94023 RepID=A0A9N8YXF0_9GLOM|nr:9620_t:CDS:1 [Acaulospora morrowiae]
MISRLPCEVLEEVFNYLSSDSNFLYNCLLVDKLWCQIIVRILWRNPWNYYSLSKSMFWSRITRTIVSMIPRESEKFMLQNGIDILSISTTGRSHMFNYLGYCKYLSFKELHRIRREILEQIPTLSDFERSHKEFILEKEIYSLFTSRSYSLAYLQLLDITLPQVPKSKLSYSNPLSSICPQVKGYLFPSYITHLELHSYFSPSLLTTISHITQVQALTINPCDSDNLGLSTLIKSQKCLKELKIVCSHSNVVFEELSQAIAEKAKMITSIRFVRNVCITSEAILALRELKLLEVDLLEFNGKRRYLNFDNSLSNLIISPFRSTSMDAPKFSRLETLNILYDDQTPLSVYTSLINSIQHSKSLKKIFINRWCVPEFNELQPYLNSITSNCGGSENLKSVTIWYSRYLLAEIEEMLKKCFGLEKIFVLCFEDLDEINEGEMAWNDAKPFLDLLCAYAPATLTNVTLSGKWNLTAPVLREFLKNWKNRKCLNGRVATEALYLKVDVYPLELDQECVKVSKAYINEGVLEKFCY